VFFFSKLAIRAGDLQADKAFGGSETPNDPIQPTDANTKANLLYEFLKGAEWIAGDIRKTPQLLGMWVNDKMDSTEGKDEFSKKAHAMIFTEDYGFFLLRLTIKMRYTEVINMRVERLYHVHFDSSSTFFCVAS